MTIEEAFMEHKQCPVKVGDTFYRQKPNVLIPDRLKVLDISESEDGYLIKAKYMYHTIGPVFERTFSDKIFEDPSWVIESR